MKTEELFEDYDYQSWQGIEDLTRGITPERVQEAVRVLALNAIKMAMQDSAPIDWDEYVFEDATHFVNPSSGPARYNGVYANEMESFIEKLQRRQETAKKRRER